MMSTALSVREADRADLVFRLKEKVFGLRPGEFGPLPVAPHDAARPEATGYAPKAPKMASTARHEVPKAEARDWRQQPRIRRLLEEL